MAVAVVLLYASADKIIHPQAFAGIVRDYRLLPEALVNLTALWLPWFELVLGLCLYTGFWRRAAVLLSLGLLSAFFAALVFNYARGLNVACGCFSSSPEEAAPMLWYLGRDALLLCLPLAAWEAKTGPTHGRGAAPVGKRAAAAMKRPACPVRMAGRFFCRGDRVRLFFVCPGSSFGGLPGTQPRGMTVSAASAGRPRVRYTESATEEPMMAAVSRSAHSVGMTCPKAALTTILPPTTTSTMDSPYLR
jgi:hypothetical protein